MRIRQWQIKPNVTRVITTPYSLKETEDVIFVNPDSSGVDIDVNLPTGIQGKRYRIVNVGNNKNNKVQIHPNGLDNLFGKNKKEKIKRGESIDINFDSIEGWY